MDEGRSITMGPRSEGRFSRLNCRRVVLGRLAKLGSLEFVASLGLLAFLTLTATLLLIIDANWPKATRVGLASGTYLVVLAAGPSIAKRPGLMPQAPSAWWFFAAGGAAGLVSGAVRPDMTLRVALVQ